MCAPAAALGRCLAFPTAWTAYEFLVSLASPHGTASSLAYSQTDFLLLLQVVSISGIWGVTFLLTLVPSALAVAWARRSPLALAAPVALLLLVLGYGAVRLRHGAGEPAVPVGLAATDEGIGKAFATGDAAEALSVTRAYAGRVARLAARGSQVVILPEKFVGVTPADSAQVRAVLAQAARASHVTLVAGLNLVGSQPRRNMALVFAPDGRAIVAYDKRHMLPGPETGYAVGTTPGLFEVGGVPWGVAICKDMDFPSWARAYGRRGVRILAVPAWDFVRDGRLHSRMAVVRAVENGFAMARAAQQGLLTFADAYGRIAAETPSSRVPDALLVYSLAPGPGPTLYTWFGDWFGWASVAALASLLAAVWSRPRGATPMFR